MTTRPQSTPPLPEHMSNWATKSLPSSHGASPYPRNNHRHSISGYAGLLPQPMYHPLQHQRGSNSVRTPGATPIRRVSSPDIKVNSLQRYSASQREEGKNVRNERRKMVRRGTFQGQSSGGSEVPDQHGRPQSIKTRGLKLQRRQTDVGQNYYMRSGSQVSQTAGVQTGSASSKMNISSQGSWEGGSHSVKDFLPSGPSHLSQCQETPVSSRLPLHNRGEAWQLEEEEEMRVRARGSRPSGHVDEALFTTRIPRHYFHSTHSHTGTSSQSYTESSKLPYQHWSISVADRQSTSDVGSQENSTLGDTQDKSTPSGTQKMLSGFDHQQQRVVEWLKGQEMLDTSVTATDDKHANSVTHSLPRPLKRSQTLESHFSRQHPTRTFSYIQAQVHPVNAQDARPHKGFDPVQMASEHKRSCSVTSEGELHAQSTCRESTSQAHKPQPTPHPYRPRTRSSPNPILRRDVAGKFRGQSRGSGRGGRDSIHPDKRFSTGNIQVGEENPLFDKFNTRRSCSPVGSDVRSHVLNHTSFPEHEEETTSSDDTGGQSDSEGILHKKKPRSKSSSSLMSKIARKLGRISVKPDQDPFEAPPPFGDERDDNTGQSGGHTLQVPTPRIQQKNLKSISTSHLERTYDGSHYRQSSLTDRLSPDYFETRAQDDHWYCGQGTPPPGAGTPHGTPLGTPHGTPKMSRSSSRSRQRSLEPDPEGTGSFTALFRSGSKRNLSADVNEALLDYVEQGNFEGVEQLLETNAVSELNVTNEDDFTVVDLAAMLGYEDIAKLLLSKGARDSTRFSRDPFSRFRHIMTLLTETEREMDSLRYELVVQNSSSSSSSAVRDMERRLRRHEWKAHLFKRMKANYECADLPDAPTDVALHVTSNCSLTVKFSEPAQRNGAPITRYKIEWCEGSNLFSPIVGEFVFTDLRTNEYVIPDLKKGEQYFVRVSAFNMKGFGQPRLSSPPSAVPSSWHDEESTQPRFEGSTDNIHIISAQLNMSLSNSPPISPSPMGGTPFMYRKTNVKKSISKLFGTNIRFQKSLRPGVYISSLVYSDDSRVAVTMDEQLPTIVISDSPATSSIGADFVWLAKVACTWDQVKGMVEVSDSYTSSPAIHSRNKMLHAILELQTVLGLQDLGLLHPVPYRDSHGAVVFVIVQYVKDMRSVQSSSLKWMHLPRLWKKRPQASASDLQAIPVPDQLILDAQEIIAHHSNSTRPLSRGLYLGYLKARSTVASMKVICSREYPNVLPHHKIRDNPNISQEEWQWLKSLSSSPHTTSPTLPPSLSHPPSVTPSRLPTTPTITGPHSLQGLLPTAVDTFLHNLGIFKEDAEKHGLYCHEVIELNEDISLLLILPPSDQVCTPPGSTDHFAKLSDFVALPINTFEIMQLYTYQKAFMTKFSMVSARLDIELLTSQQRMREAFSKAEVTAAKQLKEELESFQERTDLAWKEMRWIEEALQKGRDHLTPPNTLLPVKMFREVVRTSLPSSVRREPNSLTGYLRVFPAYTTGLINGTSVRLFITESTTTSEVVRLVVQQLEKARLDKGLPGARITEDDIDDFFLVVRQNGRETALDFDYTPLQLQIHPHNKWRLLVRRISEERRTSEHTTSV